MPKKLTRAQVIADLLNQQKEQKSDSQRTLEETKGYLKCTTCGNSVHKRTNEDAFQAFVKGPCINQLYEQSHPGHVSHVLWQRGDRLQCKNCGTQTQLDAHSRPILTNAFRKNCKGAAPAGSPPLTEIFRRQNAKASPADGRHAASGIEATLTPGPLPSASVPAGHDTQPEGIPQAPDQTRENISPLAPRQLKYSDATSVSWRF